MLFIVIKLDNPPIKSGIAINNPTFNILLKSMFISFIFFEKHDIKGFKDNFRAIYFTIAYAVVFIILNILKVYDGPYPFLQVYNQPIYMSVIWFIVIVGGAFGLGKLIMWIKNKQENKIEQ